jgi:hypothetical protein
MWKGLAIAGIVSALLLGGPCVAQQQQSQTHAEQGISQEHRDNLPACGATEESNLGKPYKPDSDNHKENAEAILLRLAGRPEWVIVYITAAYTLISLMALFTIGIQVWLMKNTAQRQLRAYVVVERGIIGNVADPTTDYGKSVATVARILQGQTGPTAQITIKNAGQTPAYEVVHWGSTSIREYPLATLLPTMPRSQNKKWAVLARFMPKIPVTRLVSVLGPSISDIKTVRLKDPLTQEQIQGLRDGNMAIYCFGEIEYRDAFKKRRTTRYRVMYSGATGIEIGVSTDLTLCEGGNWAN